MPDFSVPPYKVLWRNNFIDLHSKTEKGFWEIKDPAQKSFLFLIW